MKKTNTREEILTAFKANVTDAGCTGLTAYDREWSSVDECINFEQCNWQEHNDTCSGKTFCGPCVLDGKYCWGFETNACPAGYDYYCTDTVFNGTKAECEAKVYCSVGASADPAVCATRGHCTDVHDIPENGGCYFWPIHYKANGDIDGTYGEHRALGQFRSDVLTSYGCSLLNGVWKTRATTQEECGGMMDMSMTS